MTDMLEGWMNCPSGELDRLEHRLRMRHLWQVCINAVLVTVASGIVGVATWGMVNALSSGDSPPPSPPPANSAPIIHTIQNAE